MNKNFGFVAGAMLAMATGCGGSIPGTYRITGITCNGAAPASGLLSTWITSPSTHSQTYASSGTSATWTWANSTCTISVNWTASTTSAGVITLAPTGNVSCTGTSCAAYSTSVMGTDACTSTTANQLGSIALTASPTSGTGTGGTLTLTGQMGNSTCVSAGTGNTLVYTGTKQ